MVMVGQMLGIMVLYLDSGGCVVVMVTEQSDRIRILNIVITVEWRHGWR